MLDMLKNNAALTSTENGAVTHSTSGSYCLDLFFRAGALRNAEPGTIRRLVFRAVCEDETTALKVLFFARDIRGGLGERKVFRIAMEHLANIAPDAVRRNISLFTEYGRADDLMCLMKTRCEEDAVKFIAERLAQDKAALKKGEAVSLMGKWLPSVNASSEETRRSARYLAQKLGMTEREYRVMLSSLRKAIHIVENDLRRRDYTFDYEKLPGGALMKYINAFITNDNERYNAYLEGVQKGERKMNASALYPYQIVRRCLDDEALTTAERKALDTTWNALPALSSDMGNAIAVIDGSGSMTCCVSGNVSPIEAALSLGIYFAEQSGGAFADHFITFSEHPQLVKIQGRDIFDKTRFCASFNEVANTDLEAVFRLILDTAVGGRVPQEELPSRLYIISDMEFDDCVEGGGCCGDMTPLYDQMKAMYEEQGYRLPEVVFWNVDSRNDNVPVTMNEDGTALVSGFSPALFDMLAEGQLSPRIIMEKVLSSPRYAAVK